MANNKSKDLMKYRLDEATKKVSSSKLLLDNGMYKDSINRSYYAIFDAIRAVLALDEVDFKHHAQVIGYFNKNYVHTEMFDKKTAAVINIAFQIRNSCDYDDFFLVTKSDAEDQYIKARDFVQMITAYLLK